MIWEYRIEALDHTDPLLKTRLSEFGVHHWELAGVTPGGLFIFKRPITKETAPTLKQKNSLTRMREIRSAMDALVADRRFNSRTALLDAIDKARGRKSNVTFRYLWRTYGRLIPVEVPDFIKWLRGVAGDTGDGAGEPLTFGGVTVGRMNMKGNVTVVVPQAPEAGAEGGR
jgi:hypothetical protein